jgi:hypothetical protein
VPPHFPHHRQSPAPPVGTAALRARAPQPRAITATSWRPPAPPPARNPRRRLEVSHATSRRAPATRRFLDAGKPPALPLFYNLLLGSSTLGRPPPAHHPPCHRRQSCRPALLPPASPPLLPPTCACLHLLAQRVFAYRRMTTSRC